MVMRRRILIIALVPVVLALLAAGVAVSVDAERVGSFASAHAEAMLERPVSIDGVRLRILPLPGVRLEGVIVRAAAGEDGSGAGSGEADGGRSGNAGAGSAAGETGPSGSGSAAVTSEPIASAASIVLRPRILPLFRRQVIIDAVVIERPQLVVRADPSGSFDLMELFRAERRGDLGFELRRVDIRDGRLVYRDPEAGTEVQLDGVRQRLRVTGELRQDGLERLRLDGSLEVEALSLTLPDRFARPIHDVALRVEHRAVLEENGDRMVVDELTVRLQELDLQGAGHVRFPLEPERREVDLRFGTGRFDVPALAASLPAAVWEPPSPLALGRGDMPRLGGRAQLDATVTGPAGAGNVPAVDGRLELEGVSLGRPPRNDVVADLGGVLTFSLDSLSTGGLRGRLFGEPLRLAFTVREPASPRLEASIQTVADLAGMQELGLGREGTSLSGRVPLDLSVAFDLSEPEDAHIEGTAGLAGVHVETEDLEGGVHVGAGRLLFMGRDLRLTGAELGLAAGTVHLEAELAGGLPLLLGREGAAARLRFDARADRFHTTVLMPPAPSGAPTYGDLFFDRLAGRPTAGAVGLRMPEIPGVDLDGRLRAALLSHGDTELQDVDLRVAGSDGRIELRGASFRFLGGAVELAGRLGQTGATGHPLTLHYQVREMGAGPFFATLTPLRDHLSGQLSLAGSASLVLDDELLPIPESLAGGGTLAIMDGQLANWPVFRAVGRHLGVAQFDTLEFRDWFGRFTFDGPRVLFEESALDGGELSVLFAGAVGFDGGLDLGATLRLPRSWAAQADVPAVAQLASLAAGQDDRIPIGVRVAGTAQNPHVRADLSEAGTALAARVRAEAEAAARERADQARLAAEERAREEADRLRDAAEGMVRDAGGELPPQLPTLDSAAASVDSARTRIEAEVRSRLRLTRPPN